MIEDKYIGSKFYLKGVGEFLIKDDPKSIKLYRKLKLPIFKKKKKVDETKEEPSKQ